MDQEVLLKASKAEGDSSTTLNLKVLPPQSSRNLDSVLSSGHCQCEVLHKQLLLDKKYAKRKYVREKMSPKLRKGVNECVHMHMSGTGIPSNKLQVYCGL